MQIKRGMFRLWMVMSVIWVAGTVLVGYDAYQSEQRSREMFRKRYADETGMGMPIDCTIARGVWKQDYTVDSRSLCLYSSPVFRRLYPEYVKMTDAALLEFLLDKAGRTKPEPFEPWPLIGVFALTAFGVPLGFLVFGAALSWAFAGFRSNPT